MATLQWPELPQDARAEFKEFISRLRAAFGRAVHGFDARRWLARATWYVIIAGTAILALLAMRVWLQLTGNTREGGIIGLGYDLSGVLAAPFASFEPTTPVKSTDILEFASLVAIEAYLIGILVALTVLFSARLALEAGSALAHHRKAAPAAESALVAVRQTTKT